MPYFFCSCLAFPANYSQKEALMKSKKTYQIPDSYYSYFGIYVSGTEKQDDMAKCIFCFLTHQANFSLNRTG